MFDLIDSNGNIIESYEGKIYRYIKGNSIFYLVYDKSSFKLRAIALDADYSTDELLEILKNPHKFGFPGTMQEYLKVENDVRDLKITMYHPCGNSKGNSIGAKLFIPPLWVKMLNISEDDRDVEVKFDGEEIRIKRKG